MSRLSSPFALATLLALTACGGGAKAPPKVAPTAPTALPPANPVAVGKMVQGVQAAKDGARDRAISLLREAIAVDRTLWDAPYDLGVVLVGAGERAGGGRAEDRIEARARRRGGGVALGELVVGAARTARRRGLADFLQDHPNAVEARILAGTRSATRGSSRRRSNKRRRSWSANRATPRPSPSWPSRTSRKGSATRRRSSPNKRSARTRRAQPPSARRGSSRSPRGTTPGPSPPSARRRSSIRTTRRRASTWARCSFAPERSPSPKSSTARSCKLRRRTRARRWGSPRRCGGRATRSIRRSSTKRGAPREGARPRPAQHRRSLQPRRSPSRLPRAPREREALLPALPGRRSQHAPLARRRRPLRRPSEHRGGAVRAPGSAFVRARVRFSGKAGTP